MNHFGYPLYFASILGMWKLLGAIAIVGIPGLGVNRASGARRLFLLVDPGIVGVLLSASGRARRGERHRLAILGECNASVDRDLSVPSRILLDRIFIDAFEGKLPWIRSFGLVKASIEIVMMDFDVR